MNIIEKLKELNGDYELEIILHWWNRIVTLDNPNNIQEIRHGFLSSVGNNHAGFYDTSLAIAILPILFELEEKKIHSAYCQQLVYEIIVDLFFFEAEHKGPKKEKLLLENKVQNMIFDFSRKSKLFCAYLQWADISLES